MLQSATFWLVLATTVVVFWLLPQKLRLGFLALASFGYLTVDALYRAMNPIDQTGTVGHATLLLSDPVVVNIVALMVWALLFYFLSPLAAPRPRAVVSSATTASASTSATVPLAAGGMSRPPGSVQVLDYAPAKPAPAPAPEQRRWVLWLLIASILAYLSCFKYIFPKIASLQTSGKYLIPLGISYFTFKFIHYAVETARGNVKDRSFWRFFCYVYLFPIFTMGPIERFDHFLANRQLKWRADDMIEGLTRIVHGLIKWCFFGEMLLRSYFDYGNLPAMMSQIHWQPSWVIWRTAICSYLYLYFNFAGYTDIAIGASKLFGLGIMENFNWPILAPNIGTFWKRWHMSLTGWCMTYIYMPVLGKTRRPNFSIYVVFIAIALWHAASVSWVMWGVWHATGLVIFGYWTRFKRKRKWTWTDRGTWSPAWKFGAIAFTFLFVSVGELITCNGITSFADAGRVGQKLLFMHVQDPNHVTHNRHAHR